MTATSAPVVYSPVEVAAILGCSRTHVYRLMKAGALRAIDISVPGARAPKSRIRREDLDAFLAADAQS